jgi:Arc/MetJ-type ribon-helix-helix transcriptional regulator
MSRFTVEFSDDVDADVETLIKSLGVKTKADVIRKALNLLNYVVQEQQAGGKLVVENERQNVKKEVVTL